MHLRRYNLLVAEQTGLALQLLPMLLGFFTYKGAVVAKQSLVLFGELAGGQRGGVDGEADEASDSEERVASVDRAFRKRVLSEL